MVGPWITRTQKEPPSRLHARVASSSAVFGSLLRMRVFRLSGHDPTARLCCTWAIKCTPEDLRLLRSNLSGQSFLCQLPSRRALSTKVFGLPAVQAIIQFKWDTWAHRVLAWEFCLYLVWLLGVFHLSNFYHAGFPICQPVRVLVRQNLLTSTCGTCITCCDWLVPLVLCLLACSCTSWLVPHLSHVFSSPKFMPRTFPMFSSCHSAGFQLFIILFQACTSSIPAAFWNSHPTEVMQSGSLEGSMLA